MLRIELAYFKQYIDELVRVEEKNQRLQHQNIKKSKIATSEHKKINKTSFFINRQTQIKFRFKNTEIRDLIRSLPT